MPEQKFLTDLKVTGTVDLNNLKINTAQGTDGQVLTSTGAGVGWEDSVGVSETAERIEVTVKNISGGSLSKGTVVHTAPSANPPNGNVIEVIAADYDNSTKMPAIGILNETIANEAEGSAVMTGALSGINTSSFSIGDELYVGNLGTLTNSKPTTAGQLIQKIAVVIKSHASNGLIKIFGAGRSNDVPLPLYIDNTNQRVGIGEPNPDYELHVDGQIHSKSSTFPVYFLQRETSITGDGTFTTTGGIASGFHLRTNSSGTIQDGFGGGVVFSLTDSGTASNTAARIYARRDGGNTTGALQFWGGLNGDSPLMTMRASGKVGIGTTNPSTKLHVYESNSLDHITIDGNNGDNRNLRFATENSTRWNLYASGTSETGSNVGSDLTIAKYTDAGVYNGNVLMIKRNTGNVGIGTSDPGQKLEVDGNVIANRYYGTGSTAYYVDPNHTGTAIYTAGDIRTASTKGFTSDGLGKLYAWRAVDNTAGNGTNYVKIARLTGTAGGDDYYSDRCIIEIAGRSTSYSNNQLPAMGYIVAQLQADANWDVVYYNHDNGSGEVVSEVGVVQISNTQADIYVRVGAYAEVTASGHISDGHITVDNTRSGSAPSGYTAANAEYKVWNSGNDGSGSGLDADLLDGQQGSYYYAASNPNGYTNDQTAAEILTAIKTVDGSGSGLDADLLDGAQGSSFLRSDINDVVTPGKQISFYSNDNIESSSGDQATLEVYQDTSGADAFMQFHVSGDFGAYFGLDGSTNDFAVGGWSMGANKYKVWHAGNDGASSGLNADLLDGQHAERFFRRTDKSSATVGPGWMTVAENTSGRRAGEIVVTDADSGDHAYIRIEWMRSYGDSNFTVLNCGGHGNKITGARVLYNTSDNTYGGKKLQVYVTTSSNYEVNIYEQGDIDDYTGHTVVTPVIQNSISGYALHGKELTGLDTYGFAAEEGILAGGDLKVLGTDSGIHVDSTGHASLRLDRASTSYDNNVLFMTGGNTKWRLWQDGTDNQLMIRDDANSYNSVVFNAGGASGNTTFNNEVLIGSSGTTLQSTGRVNVGEHLLAASNVYAGGSQGFVFGSSTSEGEYIARSGDTITFYSGGAIKFDITPSNGVHFRNGSVYHAQISNSGHGRFANDVVAFYNFSDKRLKTNIKPTTGNLDKILKLNPVEYNWKEGYRKDKKEIGLIAQEVEKIIPEVVRENERLNDDTLYKQVDYEHIVSTLIGAVQEQQKQIDELKSIINGSP